MKNDIERYREAARAMNEYFRAQRVSQEINNTATTTPRPSRSLT